MSLSGRLNVEYPSQGKIIFLFGKTCAAFLLANMAIAFICWDSVQLGVSWSKSVNTEEFDCKPCDGGRIGLSIGQYLINGIFTDGKMHYTHAGLHHYIRGGLSSWGLWWNKTQQKDKKTANWFYALSISGLKNFHDKKYSHISWPCLVAYLGPMDTAHFQSDLENWNRCTLNQGWVVVGV